MISFMKKLIDINKLDFKYASVVGAFAIVFASSLWALDGAFLRPKLYEIDVFNVVLLEHLIAFMIMLPFFIYEFKKTDELSKLTKIDWLAFVGIAIFGGAIGSIAITKAFFMAFSSGHSSISVVVLIQKLQPVFAIILAAILLKERPKLLFYPLAILAFIGSYLVAFGLNSPGISFENLELIIPLFALLAAFSFATGTVLGRFAITKVSFRMGTYLRFGLTTLIMVILNLAFTKMSGISDISIDKFKILLFVALTTGGAAIFIYYWGLKRVIASHATIYELGFPITALTIDYFVNNVKLDGFQIIGALLILISIISISWLRVKKD